MFLTVENLEKSYGSGDAYVKVLKGISTQVERGKICAIMGPSGSGKSTFLNCVGGLEIPDGGSIKIDGEEIAGLSAAALAEYRRASLGFIFQFYNLVPNLTVKENIEVCCYLTKTPLSLEELMDTLDIARLSGKFPSQLSGGQQQRCAIARALIKNPKLLLCDEPTGALDSASARSILMLLEEVNVRYGTTILIVTHNQAIKAMTDMVIEIRDGMISKETHNDVKVPAAELKDL